MRVWVAGLMMVFGAGSAMGNWIGIYTTTTPTPTLEEMWWEGTLPGQFTAYLMLMGAGDSDGNPVDSISGFEVSIALPPNFTMAAELPDGVENHGAVPVFDCVGAVPVASGDALLSTITLGTFTSGARGLVYLEPVPEPEIPGQLSVSVGNPARAVVASPSSGSFVDPVFVINIPYPTPASEGSWSSLKALYR